MPLIANRGNRSIIIILRKMHRERIKRVEFMSLDWTGVDYQGGGKATYNTD